MAFPIILSSPSGGGKTTIAHKLLAARNDVGYSVSCTTRPPVRVRCMVATTTSSQRRTSSAGRRPGNSPSRPRSMAISMERCGPR